MRFDSTFDLLNQLFDDCWFEDDAARTDIYEDEKAFYIDIEVPGVKKKLSMSNWITKTLS